jgi:sortase A
VGARRVVAGVGRSLIILGVLILLFVAYQLWGTGISEARDQNRLKKEFKAQSSQPAIAPTAPGAAPAPAPAVPTGEAVAIINIPKINLEKAVVQGVGTEDLKKGPGHYPQTPMPGQEGNAAIAGHRTTYGHPFFDLDNLVLGDEILMTTKDGRFRYSVIEKKNVNPNAVEVLDPTTENILTLTTCTPKFSAAQRLIVVSKLMGPAVEAPPPPPAGTPAPAATQIEGGEGGLSGDQAAKAPAIQWGVLAAAAFFGTWYLARRWRRWPAYLIGAPCFLLLLYFFYENVARLLPANI